MRTSKQLHFDHGRMDGLERLRHTSFELNLSLVLEIPTKHPQYLPWKMEVRSSRPDHRKTDSFESLCQVQDQGYCLLIFISCMKFETCHLQQNFPDCMLRSSSASVNSTHSILYLCCHFATSGARKASHHRIIVGISASGRSLVTFFGMKKNMVVQACCGHFPHCSTFSRNFTTSSPVSFIKPIGTLCENHRNPLLSL